MTVSTRLQKKAKRICDLLVLHYGRVVQPKGTSPIDELVLTILSQNTADINSERAFVALKAAYPSWENVLATPAEDIARVIRSSGFFRIKAERIKAALAGILERTGKLDLSFLADLSVEDAKSWLTSLYGVGPKTAAIVLLFSFGMPALPVDTHVWRVTKRLGLIDRTTTRERAHVLLEAIVPKPCILSLNEHLVRHGREICLSRRPLCDSCFMSRICDYAGGQKSN